MKNKLKRFEKPAVRQPLPEQIKQAREWAVNRIMEVVDKLPANPAPVAATVEELAGQAKFGVPRQSVIFQTNDFSKSAPAKTTKNFPLEITKTDSGANTFTDEELRIIESLKDG